MVTTDLLGSEPGDGVALGAADGDIPAIVRQMLRNLNEEDFRFERRRETRVAFPKLLTLIPVQPHDLVPTAAPVKVIGKEISHTGLGFFHTVPLPYQHAVLRISEGIDAHLLFRFRWCRFLRDGWYQSGGQFLRLLPSWSATT